MERRAFLMDFLKGIIFNKAALPILLPLAGAADYRVRRGGSQHKIEKPAEVLKDIYKEVMELGKKENEEFVKGEFDFDLDGNEINSEEHIIVLIHGLEDRERIIVQVTYFEPKKGSRTIKYAKDTKVISGLLKKSSLKIDTCDYSAEEVKSLLPKILEGIREEKKLFKLANFKV